MEIKKALGGLASALIIGASSLAGCATTKADKLTPEEKYEQKSESTKYKRFDESVRGLESPTQAVWYLGIKDAMGIMSSITGPLSEEARLTRAADTLSVPKDSAKFLEYANFVLFYKDPDMLTSRNEYVQDTLSNRAGIVFDYKAIQRNVPSGVEQLDVLGLNIMRLGSPTQTKNNYGENVFYWDVEGSPKGIEEKIVKNFATGRWELKSSYEQKRDFVLRDLNSCEAALLDNATSTWASKDHLEKTFRIAMNRPKPKKELRAIFTTASIPVPDENSKVGSVALMLDVKVPTKEVGFQDTADFILHYTISRANEEVVDSGSFHYVEPLNSESDAINKIEITRPFHDFTGANLQAHYLVHLRVTHTDKLSGVERIALGGNKYSLNHSGIQTRYDLREVDNSAGNLDIRPDLSAIPGETKKILLPVTGLQPDSSGSNYIGHISFYLEPIPEKEFTGTGFALESEGYEIIPDSIASKPIKPEYVSNYDWPDLKNEKTIKLGSNDVVWNFPNSLHIAEIKIPENVKPKEYELAAYVQTYDPATRIYREPNFAKSRIEIKEK
jgi:hypothetical protein